jgi:uncharacterized membrane protein
MLRFNAQSAALELPRFKQENAMDDNIHSLAVELLESGVGALSDRDRRIIARIASKHHLARNLNAAIEQTSTLGDRTADAVARWGGSWAFIGCFGAFLAVWAVLNVLVLKDALRFDPYPFIFLNLLLSMIAAIQAPIIMMSQNRQGARDRLQANLDYEVNLKAELEIQELSAKLDRLIGIHKAA